MYIHRLKDDPDYKPGDSINYPYWAGSVLGPIVYILAVIQTLQQGFSSSIVGSVVSAFIEWEMAHVLNSRHTYSVVARGG